MDNLKLAALVREIGVTAPQVGQEYVDQLAAFTDSYNAQAKVLEQAVALATPALEAMVNTIPMRNERGIVLVDRWRKNLEPAEWGRVQEGARLYLLSNGTLAKATRELTWNSDQPAVSMEAVEAFNVVMEHEVTDVVAAIHSALIKQAGKRIPSTQKAREEASKLNAILTLLDAPPAANDEIPF